MQRSVICHAIAIPLLAYRLSDLMRPAAQSRPRSRAIRSLELFASFLVVVGFGCLMAHLSVFAAAVFAIVAILAVILASR